MLLIRMIDLNMLAVTSSELMWNIHIFYIKQWCSVIQVQLRISTVFTIYNYDIIERNVKNCFIRKVVVVVQVH